MFDFGRMFEDMLKMILVMGFVLGLATLGLIEIIYWIYMHVGVHVEVH